MKALKRNWHAMVAVFGILVLAGTFWWGSGNAAVVLAGPPYEDMAEVERDAVLTLLDDAGLDREALVALNLTEAQAESLLDAARTWRADNAATLVSLQSTIDESVVALRQIRMDIAMGPAQEGHAALLGTAIQDLVSARAAFASALSPLDVSVDAVLSDSQDSAWAALRDGYGQRTSIRLLSLSDQQRGDMTGAWQQYRREYAGAATAAERATAVSTWESASDDILTIDQETIVDSYASNFEAASEAVADAFDTVLPLAGA